MTLDSSTFFNLLVTAFDNSFPTIRSFISFINGSANPNSHWMFGGVSLNTFEAPSNCRGTVYVQEFWPFIFFLIFYANGENSVRHTVGFTPLKQNVLNKLVDPPCFAWSFWKWSDLLFWPRHLEDSEVKYVNGMSILPEPVF